jgi:NAD(P)-dependent dehydrogenase (short-subunit alcohol dehydrogenase family)
MTDQIPEAAKEAMLQSVPVKRVAEPREIADAALFLASDQAEMITGHCLPVDGGRTI